MISIIVPTLEEERFVEKTLQQIRKTAGVSYEVIVADSGSTDRTAEIASRYARVVRYDDLPKNAARGRNLGARNAEGSVFVFIDADVVIPDPDVFFMTIQTLFDSDKTLVALAARVRPLPEVATMTDRVSHTIINTLVYVVNNVLHAGGISGEAQIIRAEAFWRVGGYNEKLAIDEDNDIYRRLARIGRVRTVRALLVEHPSRRAHALGWTRLWTDWILNFISVLLFGKPWHETWLHIR